MATQNQVNKQQANSTGFIAWIKRNPVLFGMIIGGLIGACVGAWLIVSAYAAVSGIIATAESWAAKYLLVKIGQDMIMAVSSFFALSVLIAAPLARSVGLALMAVALIALSASLWFGLIPLSPMVCVMGSALLPIAIGAAVLSAMSGLVSWCSNGNQGVVNDANISTVNITTGRTSTSVITNAFQSPVHSPKNALTVERKEYQRPSLSSNDPTDATVVSKPSSSPAPGR